MEKDISLSKTSLNKNKFENVVGDIKIARANINEVLNIENDEKGDLKVSRKTSP